MSRRNKQPLTSAVIDEHGLLVGTTGPLLPPVHPPRPNSVTISQAIAILSLAVHGHAFALDKRFYDSLKLALEVLTKFGEPKPL